jgi:hypothetical protein
MTVARTIRRSAAEVVEQLELDGTLLVTFDRLAALLRQDGQQPDEAAVRRMAYDLQQGGWLGPLRTREVWEFLPGARGGAFGSGDQFIEFRAQHAVNPGWSGTLAMESAASVLGLAQRIPEREVVALDAAGALPKALEGQWRFIRLAMPVAGCTVLDSLPTWTLEALIVGIATRPSSYQDLPGLGQWLPQAAGRVNADIVISLLAGARSATRQRAAYLLGAGGNAEGRSSILTAYPATSAVWFGPRVAGAGVFDSEAQVNDTALHPYLAVGTGA